MNDKLTSLGKYGLFISHIVVLKLLILRLVTTVFPILGMVLTPIIFIIIGLRFQKNIDWLKRWHITIPILDIYFSIKVMNNYQVMVLFRWMIIPFLVFLLVVVILAVVIFLTTQFVFNNLFYDVIPNITKYSFNDIYQIFIQLFSSFLDVSYFLYHALDNRAFMSGGIRFWGLLPFNLWGFSVILIILIAPYISILIFRYYKGDFITRDLFNWKKSILPSIFLLFNIYAMIYDMIHGGSIVMDFIVISIVGFSLSVFTFRFI